MIYSEEQWEIQKQQLELLQNFFKTCAKMQEIEEDRQEAIRVLEYFERQKAIITLLKLLNKYCLPNQFLMNALQQGDISDFQLLNELGNIVRNIYFFAILKYSAEEKIKKIAKQEIERQIKIKEFI